MSLNHSQSPKINPTEQTPQSGLHHHENSHLAESAYITSEYQKTAQTPTTQRVEYETHAKIESSSPNQHVDSSRFSTDDKNSYSAYSTTGLASTLGSAALNYQYASKDYTLPSTYGTSTSYSYQPSAKIEEYSKSYGNPEPVTQSYSYSSYKRETTSPTIKALNENTASLLGRSTAIENNFGKTSLTLQERYGLTPALSFGATNYSADLGNLGLAKEEHKTSDNLKYSDYLKSKHTVQSFEYGKSPYEQTFGSTAGLAGEETKKSGLQQQSKGLYSSTDYTDLINKISNKPAEPKNDAYTILKPDSLTNTEKKQRQTVGSHYYQSTYPNTVRTPSESGRKERDRYANSELSAAASPPFKRDKLEVSHHQEVVDDYVISDPHITKKTLYTIENSGSISINGGKDFVNQLGLHKTPERKIKSKSGSPSPFDDLKHALKNESVQISKIVIETVENYGGETEAHETHHHKHPSEKFDIVMEQGAHNTGHSRNGSIKSPTNNIKIQRKLIEDSSSFKDPVHHHHSRKPSDTSSSKVGGTITAINDRIKDLDNILNQGVRSSASKYQSLLSSNSKAESAGVHHRAPHHHHEEKNTEKEDEKLRAQIEKEKEKEREKQEKEKQKEREKQEKERQKQEKERQKKEQEEAKAKAKQAAAAAKESNKHHHDHSTGQFIVKLIIAFIVLLLLGVLSFELIMGAEEYDALLDTPLNQVFPN